jgi:FixJ family two-component response regulator
MSGDRDVEVRNSGAQALPALPAGGVADLAPEPCIVGLVDDDPAVLRAMVRLLVAMGYAAAPFPSAEDLLAWGKTSSLCCLLLDVELGDMTGPELYVRLLASGEDLPVIFISAVADAASIVRAHTGITMEVLAKPIDADCLCDVIARAVLRAPL